MRGKSVVKLELKKIGSDTIGEQTLINNEKKVE